LCDEFYCGVASGGWGIANIQMTNVTGGTNQFVGEGTLNLSYSNISDTTSREDPRISSPLFVTGAKDYLFGGGTNTRVNLLGKWDNGDTITCTTGGAGVDIMIDGNAHIKDTTINVYGSTLKIEGKTEDTQINYTGGTIIFNGATMLVSDQNKQIVTAPFTGSTVKAYTGGLNTNKLDPFSGATELVKIDVTGLSGQTTINGETFTSTTGTTNAEVAEELVLLINASGTLDATASQDTPGTDTYFYVESDILGTGLVITYDVNTAFSEQIRYNSNIITETIGGPIIQDTDIT
jgi:hypothetical protein